MDRREQSDDPTTETRPGPTQPAWVKFVAVGVIALVVMATVASALLS